MGFTGAVLDMLSRDRFNESLRKSSRSRHSEMRKAFLEHHNNLSDSHLKTNTLSQLELEIIKLKIGKKIKRDRRVELIKSFTILGVIIAILTLIFFMIM